MTKNTRLTPTKSPQEIAEDERFLDAINAPKLTDEAPHGHDGGEDSPEDEDDPEHEAHGSKTADAQARRVERICANIGRLSVDGIGELATTLVQGRGPIAALLHACLQQALQQSFSAPRGPRPS